MSDPLPLFERGDPHLQLHNKERELINELLEGGGGGGVSFPTVAEAVEDELLVAIAVLVPQGEYEAELGPNPITTQPGTLGLVSAIKLEDPPASYSAIVSDDIPTGLYSVTAQFSGDTSVSGTVNFGLGMAHQVSGVANLITVLRPGLAFEVSVTVSGSLDMGGGGTVYTPVSEDTMLTVTAIPLLVS